MLGTLLGNYRVVQRLGEGGMGVVYIGRHEALGHRAVVKVLLPELSSNRAMVQRFFNEAQAATAIRSPGIVQVFDFGVTSDGRAYFVMELLDGESLAARLERGACDAVACCRLGRQIANVLQAAHGAGIIHRDLKPDNLFLVPDPEVSGGERVKVLDFGIAKLVGEARATGIKTVTNLAMGTPDYMSPEQCRSASTADARSDVYSLGCILFELACGRRPFVFSGIGDVVAAHLHDPPPHPLSIVPDLPPRLAALILRLLAKHADARPQTMEAVSQALGEILQSLDSAPARAAAAPPASPGPSGPAGPTASSAPARPSPPPAAVASAAKPVAAAAATVVTAPEGVSPAVAAAALVAPRASASAAGPRPVASPSGSIAPSADAAAPSSPSPPSPSSSSVERPGHGARAAAPLPRVALPVALPPHAVTLLEPTRKSRVRSRINLTRILFMAGSVVCAGIAGAIVIVLVVGRSSSAGELAAPGDLAASRVVEPPRDPVIVIATGPPPAPAAAPGGPNASPPAPADPQPATATATAAPSSGAEAADRIARDCSGHLLTRHWQDLAQCADRLQPLDAARAAELRARATEELRSAPHSTAATAALRDHNLKQAKIELDQVWSGSVELAALKRAYEAAEAREIDALATELESLRDASCNAFHERLAAVRTRSPAHVLAEVTHRVHCTTASATAPAAPAAAQAPATAAPPTPPPAGCDADALAGEGGRQFSAGHLAESLAAYEAAYACQPSGPLLQKQLVVACNLHDEARARALWRRLSDAQRTPPLLAICIRNGLTEATLSAP